MLLIRFVFPVNETIEVTRQNIAEIFLNSPLGKYGIVLKENKSFIRTIDFHHWRVDVKKAEIGYCSNKVYWNKGYATEVLQILVRLAFDILGLNCLIAKHDNEFSLRLAVDNGHLDIVKYLVSKGADINCLKK